MEILPNSLGESSSFYTTLCHYINRTAHSAGVLNPEREGKTYYCTSVKVQGGVGPEDNGMT